MEPFQNVKSIVTPLDKVNVDTDQIIPKQFVKKIFQWNMYPDLFRLEYVCVSLKEY